MKMSLLSLVLCSSVVIAAPKAELLVNHLDKPVYMTAPKGGESYFYIVEKPGVIKVYDRKKGEILKSPFLDLSSQIKIRMNEQGLLGMAFSPTFADDKRFYLYYTDTAGDTKVSRFVANSELSAELASEEVLLEQKQDYKNHNGGWIGFGPDGMLYIGLGDGGAANDPKQRSQDLNSLLGKLLRIDVNSKKGYTIPKDNPFIDSQEALPEILSYGLRNPWRCAWDANELIIADVGQNAWEEINVVTHKELFGANFGWPQFEGTHETKNKKPKISHPGELIEPVYEYRHDNKNTGGFSITGGYPYKGKIEALKGRYFFADYVKPHIWSAKSDDGAFVELQHHKDDFSQHGKPIKQISSFATDEAGEIYIISHQGQIYQIVE